MSAYPETHKALTASREHGYRLITKPVPTITGDEVLVKVRAVTLNPTDWKHASSGRLEDGSSFGCDFAGDIEAVGANVGSQGFKVGDAVAGFIRGGIPNPLNGSFQEYVESIPELVWHKPSNLNYEDASSMGGIALSTAVQAVYQRLQVPPPYTGDNSPKGNILVWAGSTSVGLFAIHLAKASGLKIVTTASPKNFELLKELGANEVFDYRDPEVAEKIQNWAKSNGDIPIAVDTISEHGSIELAAKSIKEGGYLVTLLDPGKEWPNKARVEATLIYSALDKKNGDDFQFIAEWYRQLPELVEAGKIRNAIPLVQGKGLEAIPAGLRDLQDGKMSASKLAYTL